MLSLKWEDLQAQSQDIKDHLEEVREQAACRFASEMEGLQNQHELLFSTWSEDFKEGLEERQDRLHEHAQGDHLALEIRVGQLERALSPLSKVYLLQL